MLKFLNNLENVRFIRKFLLLYLKYTAQSFEGIVSILYSKIHEAKNSVISIKLGPVTTLIFLLYLMYENNRLDQILLPYILFFCICYKISVL